MTPLVLQRPLHPLHPLRVLCLCALLAVGLWGVPAQAAGPTDQSTAPANVLDGEALLQALRKGGHVLYFRHGKTDLATKDTDRTRLDDCSTQRQLSAQGQQEMKDIGRAFVALGIPVGGVRSSPYCRALDSARLAFGKAQADDDLRHTVTADEATTRQRAQALERLLATPPAAGTNTVLAGHTGNLQEASGIWPSPEGVAVIFAPDGQGKARFVASVPPERWLQWQQAQGGKRRR